MDYRKKDSIYYHKYIKYKHKYLALKQGGSDAIGDYPYYNLFYRLDKDKFKKLIKDFEPHIINFVPEPLRRKSNEEIEKYDDKYILIQENWNKNEELNNVTDYFTEECRVKCQFANYQSPYDYWQENKDKIMKLSLEKHDKINIKFIRDYMFYNTKLCNNFRISVALTILDMFKAKKWLDISAGWGDRLIAAIGHGVDMYCGVDPNDCLHPKYKDIIKTLVPKNKRDNYILIKDGFENAKLPDTKFDLIFSSPPFFDLEIYSESSEDSFVKYEDVDMWYEKFLMVSLKKAYRHLEKNGHMVLYISEGIGTDYVNKMIKELNKIMEYEGIIYYFYPVKYKLRKLYVWKKVESYSGEREGMSIQGISS